MGAPRVQSPISCRCGTVANSTMGKRGGAREQKRRLRRAAEEADSTASLDDSPDGDVENGDEHRLRSVERWGIVYSLLMLRRYHEMQFLVDCARWSKSGALRDAVHRRVSTRALRRQAEELRWSSLPGWATSGLPGSATAWLGRAAVVTCGRSASPATDAGSTAASAASDGGAAGLDARCVGGRTRETDVLGTR
mgnify:CR=1 FL=1